MPGGPDTMPYVNEQWMFPYQSSMAVPQAPSHTPRVDDSMMMPSTQSPVSAVSAPMMSAVGSTPMVFQGPPGPAPAPAPAPAFAFPKEEMGNPGMIVDHSIPSSSMMQA